MPRGVPNKKEVTEEVVNDMDDVMAAALEAQEVEVQPEPPVTMDDAFHVLCKAILNNVEELPDIAKVRDIQIRFTDGHKKLAWQQIWDVTQEIVGVPY